MLDLLTGDPLLAWDGVVVVSGDFLFDKAVIGVNPLRKPGQLFVIRDRDNVDRTQSAKFWVACFRT